GDLWYEKGRALRMLKRNNEALTAYTEALKHPISNPGLVFYERSVTNFMLNKKNEAKADLQKAREYKFTGIDAKYQQQLGM
ncbi:MAG TPA: tetratricopeptide repeat protein, partial [Saprospiraceae bacterium]|nr:tetratricopeptide repeat protein [Saprospiraceae bacterium]